MLLVTQSSHPIVREANPIVRATGSTKLKVEEIQAPSVGGWLAGLTRYSWVIACVTIALSTILAGALAIYAGPHLRYTDEQAYRQIAAGIVQHHQYTTDGQHSSAYRPPGFVFLLAMAEFFHASNVALRLVNVAALVAAQFFLFLLVRAIHSPAAAAIAVMLSFCYPVLTYTSTLLFPQTLGAALLLCGMWLVMGNERVSVQRGLCAGLVWGWLILSIPTFSIMAVVLSAYVLIRDRRSLKGLVAFAVAASLISGCWCYRNYTVFHKFVFVSTNGGSNLLIGNSWNASGTSDSSTMPAEDAAVGHSLFLDAAHTVPDEIAADRYYSQAAKQWIATHPHQALQLYIAKLIHYFGFEDHMATTDPGSYAGNSRITFILMAVSYGPLLAVLVCRLIFFRMIPLSFAECVIATLYLMNALLSAVFFTRIRFRLPMDWLLIAFVASSVCLVLGRLERPRALGQSTPVQ